MMGTLDMLLQQKIAESQQYERVRMTGFMQMFGPPKQMQMVNNPLLVRAGGVGLPSIMDTQREADTQNVNPFAAVESQLSHITERSDPSEPAERAPARSEKSEQSEQKTAKRRAIVAGRSKPIFDSREVFILHQNRSEPIKDEEKHSAAERAEESKPTAAEPIKAAEEQQKSEEQKSTTAEQSAEEQKSTTAEQNTIESILKEIKEIGYQFKQTEGRAVLLVRDGQVQIFESLGDFKERMGSRLNGKDFPTVGSQKSWKGGVLIATKKR